MSKKSFNEKLNNTKELPKVQFVGADNKMAKRFGCGNMLIAAPIEYDEVMKRIPEGKLITSDEIRAFLAKKHNADFTCQLTAGIFINIAANASQERENSGSSEITPYWRTLKKGGELNEKYPGGIDKQRLLLEMEGHEIIQKGKRYFVKDYQKALHQL
ncbi:MAG: MGMT family protein [Peptococcaceae bacterium]|nr:MGMT family protein [Peptococcaceae bacterium]MDH7525664.1 MGMT family protein [Peptococcaceae bacterium]